VSNIHGEEFSFYVYLNKIKDNPTHWEISVWNYKGNTTIGTWRKPYESNDDKLSDEEILAINQTLEEFSHGILHCSDCEITMPANNKIKFDSNFHKQEYGGHYFAAHYCKECWERKWKAIKEKETYE
jgi:hypothetical protein